MRGLSTAGTNELRCGESLDMSGNGSIVVFDTEYTSWPGAEARGWSHPQEHREIVQIGAVRLDSQFAITATLDSIVRPTINSLLSEFFVDLTGITQERVDRDGCSFAEALAEFERFVTDSSLVAYSNGPDDRILEENMELYKLHSRLPSVEFINIQPWFKTAIGWKGPNIRSCDVLARVGSSERFPSHDAVGDATSVAVAIRHLKSEGAPPLPHEVPVQ